MTKAADAASIVETAQARLGRIDILVNNVGIGGGDGPAHVVEEAAFDRILSVNLKGMWLVTKAVLPVMRGQKAGAIVNISSLAARAGGIQVAYEISKAGVNRLTAHVPCPRRGTASAATPSAGPDARRWRWRASPGPAGAQAEVRAERDQVPLGGQMGTAWDTAYAALFLASDEAKFVTGAVLPVDGGMGGFLGIA